MIKKIHLTKFKKYTNENIKLKPEEITLIVGGNNSGKSTIIHSLAIWEFCKTVVLFEKGIKGLTSTNNNGVGIDTDEFTPVAVADLSQLWTNLKTQKSNGDVNGYNLRIECVWDSEDGVERYLEFGLSLTNNRLFIKTTKTNISESIKIPKIAYLPPFSGLIEKEKRVNFVEKQRQIGKGLSGNVLRNMIYDLYEDNQEFRLKLLADKKRLREKEYSELRLKDGYENLARIIRSTFKSELVIKNYNPLYHSYLSIQHYKGKDDGKTKLTKYPNYTNRDLITEGSGYLQFLSVIAFAVDKNTDVLLLDEPDAHLHSKLQELIISNLIELQTRFRKQIIISTHSPEMIKKHNIDNILAITDKKIAYINDEVQRISVLNGLGSEYTPKLYKLAKSKKLLFVENESDANILKIIASKINLHWDDNIVIWPTTDSHKDRKLLFEALKTEIGEFKAVSIRDRDMEEYKTVGEDLIDKAVTNNSKDKIQFLKWRRKHIENYFILPKTLANIGNTTEEEIDTFMSQFGITLKNINYTQSEVPSSIYNCEGKQIISMGANSFNNKYGKSKYDIAKNIDDSEICEDLKTAANIIINFLS